MKQLLPTIFLVLFFAQSLFAQTSFTGKPMYKILTKRAGVYLGTTTIELFPNIAPLHVKNFDSLVSVQFFDSTAFHRVIPGFMIQGGDPNSRHGAVSTWGNGDPSQPTVNAEFSAAKHVRGTLSAARDTGINSANSQFFICVAPAAWLNNQYSIYGRVTEGINIVDTIVSEPRDINDNPFQKIEMFISYIGSNDTVPVAPLLNIPTSGTMGVGTSKTLKWFAGNDAIIYHLEISSDSTFATIFKTSDLAGTSYFATSLLANTTYYWRVKTNNGGHFSPYSSIWNFNTTGVSIEAFSNSTNKIVVSPNPSAGSFNFSSLDKDNSIEIFDLTGKIIYRSNQKNTSCTIDLSDKDKGIYFYKVISNKKDRFSGKIILY